MTNTIIDFEENIFAGLSEDDSLETLQPVKGVKFGAGWSITLAADDVLGNRAGENNPNVNFPKNNDQSQVTITDVTGRGFEFISVDVEIDLPDTNDTIDPLEVGGYEFGSPPDPGVEDEDIRAYTEPQLDEDAPFTTVDENALKFTKGSTFSGQKLSGIAFSNNDPDGNEDFNFDNIVLNFWPTAEDDEFMTDEDDVLSGVNVITNTDPNGADSDPDPNDPLTIVEVNGNAADVGSILTLPSGATLQVVGSGNFVFNPSGAYDELAPGESDTETFSYTIADSLGHTDTATVTITIKGSNDALMAVDDTETTDEDTGVTFNVLTNDVDIDAGTLTAGSVDTSTLQGSLTFNGDGSFTYDPDGQFEDLDDGETAQDVFTYTVGDGQGGFDTAQVTITITGITDTPPNLQVDVQPWDNPVLNGSLEGDNNLGTSLGEGLGEAFVFEGSGNAQVNGTGLGDEITGGPANDRLSGSDGDDIINGEGGIDRLAGGNGNDVLNGGENNDVLYGNNGNDQLVGGPGADLLDGGAGNDILTGNEGADLFIYDGRGDDVITDFMVGEDELQLPVGAEPEVEVTDAGTVLTFDDPLGSLTLAGVIVDLDML